MMTAVIKLSALIAALVMVLVQWWQPVKQSTGTQ